MNDIALALWFLVPVALANATPVFAAAIPGLRHLNTPMDFGKKFRGKRIFGDHKTWRGLLSGMAIATLVFWLQKEAYIHTAWAQHISQEVNYSSLPLLLGPLFGLGALGGDAIESFFKRQRGIDSGNTWLFFDQLDYIIGGLLISLPFVILTIRQYLLILFFYFGIHLLVSYVGWKVGLKEKPI